VIAGAIALDNGGSALAGDLALGLNTLAAGDEGLISAQGGIQLLQALIDGVEAKLELSEGGIQLEHGLLVFEVARQRADEGGLAESEVAVLSGGEGTQEELLGESRL